MTYICNFRVQELCSVNTDSALRQARLGSCQKSGAFWAALLLFRGGRVGWREKRGARGELFRPGYPPGWPLFKCEYKKQTNGRITDCKPKPSPSPRPSQIQARRHTEISTCPDTEKHGETERLRDSCVEISRERER